MSVASLLDEPHPAGRLVGPLRWRAGALVFLMWFGVLAGWSLATPVWGSPDEFEHAFRAYSAAHGQLYVAPKSALHGTGGFVDVPRGWLNSVQHYRCDFRRDAAANCLPPLTNDGQLVRVASTAARYNPLYYLAVGSASLITSPAHAVRVMRLASAALSALFLGWAFTAALTARRPRFAASIVLFAATPMALFLGSAINPNGLEITAAICAWTCGYQAMTSPDPAVGRILRRRTAIALMAVVETRVISPLWVAIIVAALIVAAGRRQVWLRCRRGLVGWGVALAVATLLAGIWSVLAKTGQLENHPVAQRGFAQTWQNAWDGGLNQLRWLQGTVGNFGWLNTPLTPGVTYAWLFVAAGLLLVAFRFGTSPERRTILALGVVVVVLPTAITAVDWNRYGLFWQARYTMPISLGLVLLSGTSLARSPRLRMLKPRLDLLAATVATFAIGVDLVGFVVALSRYSVGLGPAISITGRWQPPLGGPAVTVLETACLGALAITGIRSSAGKVDHGAGKIEAAKLSPTASHLPAPDERLTDVVAADRETVASSADVVISGYRRQLTSHEADR